MLYGFDLGVPSTSLAPGLARWWREKVKKRETWGFGGGCTCGGCLEARDRWGRIPPFSVPLGRWDFGTPAQMLLHCLELRPNGEQALISYCLPLTVDSCDKCSSRWYLSCERCSCYFPYSERNVPRQVSVNVFLPSLTDYIFYHVNVSTG